MSDVRTLIADYEAWLAGRITIDDEGLARKHAEMADKELSFLRGTYCLWLVRVAERLPQVFARPAVPLVGDLHLENFGTWRDHAQVRRWGINDLDELASGAWLLDLLRLATSAVVAPHIKLDAGEVCAELLTTYAGGQPRAATDLAELGAGHLAGLVPPFADPADFYRQLAGGAPCTVPDQVVRAALAVAEPGGGRPGTGTRRAPARWDTSVPPGSDPPATAPCTPGRPSSSVRAARSGLAARSRTGSASR